MRSTALALAAALAAGPTIGRATAASQALASAASPASPALAASAASAAAAAVASSGAPALQPSLSLHPLPQGDAARALPSVLQARRIVSQPDFLTTADGDAEYRRGGLVVHADHLSYDAASDVATARGQVRVKHDGAVYSGPEMQLQVERFSGYFLRPEFQFTQLGSHGRADRIDFIDADHSRATNVDYTSCKRVGSAEPDWLLRADSVTLDTATDEGVARGAVLHFLGVPILALPTLSFPLSNARQSGWLPPTFDTNSRSGVEIAVPYYWNIAPNRDATLTPRAISRRGFALDSEFRYLEPSMQGTAALSWLPLDRLTGRARNALQWTHGGELAGGARYGIDAVHVSDDGWWKDFPSATRSLTPRLLAQRADLERPFALAGGSGLLYARAQGWQVLQGSAADPIVVAPYQRSPQLGLQLDGRRGGWRYALQTEYNHFTLPAGQAARAGREGGVRLHLLGDLSHPWREPGWFVVPRLSLNSATYLDADPAAAGGQRVTRTIPTFSVDAGLDFERRTVAFGHAFRQTLEPRLLYAQTPYRPQSQLPNYDAAAKDFNFSSIYSVNQFSGVDRVSDGSTLTAGVTSRFIDATSGAEALRLGLVQRYLFGTQRETAQADGTPDGPPTSRRLSDVLLLGSTSLVPSWSLNSTLQYSPAIGRSVRSIVGAVYAPGPYRTLSATYRLSRGLTEQLELGWQWPIWSRGGRPGDRVASHAAGAACGGTWYSVGRLNYSLRDSRITDSVVGAEYDAGCWVARVVAERLATGTSEATTRLEFQLELVGLSRLGSNPLQVLKDNIPGYRLLHDTPPTGDTYDPTAPYRD
ncbi:MAG: LPS-assembly protein LptD [Burkholderiales bacterium]|nr:LPS-assembly protein LptD [Burkholderiales bacterium]